MINLTLRSLFKVIVLLLTVIFPLAGSAHHSDAGLDLDSVVVLEGKVTEFSWKNPHIYFTMQAVDQHGQSTEWKIQMASIPWISRNGWRRDALAAGDEVIVRAHPALDGRTYGAYISIEKNGVILPKNPPGSPITSSSTTTLEGTWRGDRSTIGDFTEFFNRLVPTEKGAAARDAFDALSTMNPMSGCLARPTPSTLVSAGGYLEEIEFVDETIILRTEIFDTQRTVFMNGRSHPLDVKRTIQGHSTGRWEEDVLIVDTVGFSDHRSPYQNGIPSGAELHVLEKYRLSEDGTRIILEMMVEDPEYLAVPLTHTMEWIYAPERNMLRWNCDQESTQAFLPQ
jgi:hypothetical protein